MNSTIWDQFAELVSVNEVNNPKPQIEPIAPGVYEARLEQFEPSTSKKGLPMIKGRFRLKNNRIIFYNQMLQNVQYPNMTAVNINDAVKTVGQLLGEKIEFLGMPELAETINSIPLGSLYKIEVSYGKKDLERAFTKINVISLIDETPTQKQTVSMNDFGSQSPFA